VLLLLIQLGGLGIMTFSTLLLLAVGQRLSLSARVTLRNTLSQARDQSLGEFVSYVVKAALLTELAGAILLTLLFHRAEPWGSAVKHGLFHAVSAFCNAGFGLYSDSLVRYRSDPGVNLVIMGLIVLGGLGFVVLVNVRDRLFGGETRQRTRLTLHSRVVLWTTMGLVLVGLLGLLITEWQGSLSSMPAAERFLAAALQSVTCRTAGFNTLDLTAISLPGICILMLLMTVGGSPGSTAGGLKTTTMAILLGLARSRWRGEHGVQLARRGIPDPIVSRATATAAAGVIAVGIVTFALLVSECGVEGPAPPGSFLRLGFEAVSALGTVGLSLGVTPELSTPGRLIIIIAMFVGRLGPLTVAVAVARRKGARVLLAEEEVLVG
jgi:trk system potassium uptake protein TrkH